jgi:short subunit dehydrogenase-like uncharacterized protein
MERMQLEYHKAAEEKGVYAISACGFDSIPADLGTVYLMNKFKGLSLTFTGSHGILPAILGLGVYSASNRNEY